MPRSLAHRTPVNPVLFMSLDDIQKYEFRGTAADSSAYEAINEFVSDAQRPVEERAEAIRVMCERGLGIGRPVNDDKALVFNWVKTNNRGRRYA